MWFELDLDTFRMHEQLIGASFHTNTADPHITSVSPTHAYGKALKLWAPPYSRMARLLTLIFVFDEGHANNLLSQQHSSGKYPVVYKLSPIYGCY